jgi:hypothetical protein
MKEKRVKPQFSLTWRRCGKTPKWGEYRIEERPEPPKRGRKTVAHQAPQGGTYIVATEPGATWTIRPLEMIKTPKERADGRDASSSLARNFAKRPSTAEGMMHFVNEYGFLRSADATEWRVDDLLADQKDIKHLVALAKEADWYAFSNAVEEAKFGRPAFRLVPPSDDIQSAPLHQIARRPSLVLELPTLFDAIVAQFIMHCTIGAEWRRCANPECFNFFGIGPGIGLREGAAYCRPKCQARHSYLKRRNKETEK